MVCLRTHLIDIIRRPIERETLILIASRLPSTQNTRSQLAMITFLLAMIVILLGAYTRLTDSGLSCPDWPHCYGYLTAPHTDSQLQAAAKSYPAFPVNTTKAWTEMTHRYFAGLEGLLIITLAVSFLITRKIKDNKSLFIGIGLLGLLGMQVLLGMWTVTEKLRPIIVLLHLLTGLSLLSILWIAYLELTTKQLIVARASSKKLSPWLYCGALILVIQITLGGLVSSHYAGLACIDFPYCNGKLFPALDFNHFHSNLVTIHMQHRIGAFVTATYLCVLSFFLFKHPHLRALASLLLVLIGAQITLGILNILWLRPVFIALAHHAIAILLLLTMLKIIHQSSLRGQH
jgi:cytochrome c oxidase assembly protein subunit 15